MEMITMLGLGGAFLTTGAFVPQVIRSWTTKKTHDLSLIWMLCLISGFILWLSYGWLIGDLPLLLANGFSLALVFCLLWMKLRWGMDRVQ